MPQQSLQPVEIASGSVLSALRRVLPHSPLTFAAGLQLAERLASRLLELYGIDAAPVPTAIITGLPSVRLAIDQDMPPTTSGSSVWDSQRRYWIIKLNGSEPARRLRFTVNHELFHIVMHPAAQSGIFSRLSAQQVERLADYFAGCVLIPKRLLVRAWAGGMQTPSDLARLFHASPQAVQVRLQQVRLDYIDEPVTDMSPGVAA